MTTQQTQSARPYSCKICKKKFSQLSNLQFHQRVHSRTKPFTCKQCHTSFRQQYLLQQHIKSTHPAGSTAQIICKLCQNSFNTLTALQSHLVKSHSAYLASRTAKCATKERHKLHRRALNGANKKAMKDVSGVMRNGAIHDVNDNHGCSDLHNGTIGNRVSTKNQESQPDRTILHLDIDPTPAINTVPVKHQIICSPDSTTDAFGITKTRPAILPTVSEESKDSPDEPKWYIGAPDGKMEEMDVSYKEKYGMDDNTSQGTRDTDDIDVISSALESPVCQLSPRELQLEPSSTTSPDAPSVGNSPARSPEYSSIISIGSTPVASPACPTVGSSPAFVADDTSQPATIEACESEPVSPVHREASPDAELLYGQCGDSDDDIVKRHINLREQRRQSISSDSEIDVETDVEIGENHDDSTCHLKSRDVTPTKEFFHSSTVSAKKIDLLQDTTPERARGLTVSPEKDTVDTPIKVAEDVFNVDDQDATETGEDAESLGSSTGCMPLLEQMPLQSPVHDSPRARHMRRQNSKDDMPVIEKEMPCIEKEFPVLERQTSISPDYRRCDMKEELTSSTDQESPNSTGTDVDQPPPDIRPQYGPSVAPATKSAREVSTEKETIKNQQQKAEVDPAYFGDDDDQYTGSTEEEEEYWNEGRMEQNVLEENHNASPKPRKHNSVKDSGKRDRQIGFFDVFANFLQNKDQEVEENPDNVIKEKKRLGRPPKRKPEPQPKSEYMESSEGEDLGEFRVETADPTVLKISRVSPTSRTPARTPERKTETPIPEQQRHMVASTNGTVVTLRRISSTKPNTDPVHGPSEQQHTNPQSGQDVTSVNPHIKTESTDVYQFAETDLDADNKVTETTIESQDANSGTYTLRKRKKVNFNLLAEGNLSDNDFIPDPPEVKKTGEFVESPHKKAGRARKKKPFDKAHFMNYNRRLLRLRKGVCMLLETLFPEMIYPRRFNPESHAVDYLVDYISGVAQDKELGPSRISRCYGDIDWDPTILLCSAPKDCLRHLRRRLMKMLKALLPGLKVNRYFDHSSASVDALIEEITFVNAQQTSSQLSHPIVPLPSELSSASPTCSRPVESVSAQKPKATGTKRKSRENSATEHVERGQGDSAVHVSPTPKRKRHEKSVDSETLMPPPVVPLGGGNSEEQATKRQQKNSTSSAGGAICEPQPSTSTGSTESTAASVL